MNIPYLPKGYDNAEAVLHSYKTDTEEDFIKRGERRALELFHLMSQRVPAYKDFLNKNAIDAEEIKTISDFKKVPILDKKNYLTQYDLADLCWDGQLKQNQFTIAATSGSTGEPFYFPREHAQDLQYSLTAEIYLLNTFEIQKKSTLYINGFGMGIWIGGVFTYQAIKLLSERRKYPISIITPGSSKDEILNAVKKLGVQFDQIIIAGYPPFVKDTLDEGVRKGINWKKYKLKFIFSAEGFGELFRDYISSISGLENTYRDTLNHYGTVDLGTMAHETPLSILVRKIVSSNSDCAKKLFKHEYKQPTVAQYSPEMFFFEEVDSILVCSAYSGLPLVRYSLKDTGGILSFETIKSVLIGNGINIDREIAEKNLNDVILNLPIVYIHERNDFTVKLSGANIYPEEIRRALNSEVIQKFVTGKFQMQIIFDDNQDQMLEINIELKQNVRSTLVIEKQCLTMIVNELLQSNSEYKYLYSLMPKKRIMPRIELKDYGDPLYFKSGVKQKWVRK